MCSPPFLDTNYYLFNQTDLELRRQLREAVSYSTEVCSCLLPIASASFHLHHTFLLFVLVRAHIYLQRCSLTENTLTSFPLCIDSGLLFFKRDIKHLFFPTTSVLFFLWPHCFWRTHIRLLSRLLRAQTQDRPDLGRHRTEFPHQRTR